MSKYKVVWAPEAQRDLLEICQFIARDRPRVALSLFKKIQKKCLALVKQPESGRLIPELEQIGNRYFRELICSPYRVLYKNQEEGGLIRKVLVLAVVDSRRDFESTCLARIVRAV